MNLLRPLLPAMFVALVGSPLWSADAPTAEEWSGVEQALNEDAPDASAKLSALVAAYPRWSDGHRTLAQVLLRQGKADAALTAAKQAMASAPSDANAAAVAIQALGALQRPADAFAIADQFIGDKDPQGWVNFRAAEVALNSGDRAKADLHLSLANGRVKKSPPAEFAYLDARISAAAGDLDRAEVSLNRALAANPRLWDAWYELGVVQLRQADAKTASTRREYLDKAIASFGKVTAIHGKDALAWLGLGRAQVTLAQDLLIDRADEGRALAAKAAASLKNAVDLNDGLRDAHLNLGVALLVDEHHEQAITHLLRARDLGSTSRTLGFNLMLAYQKAGRAAEFEAEARNVQAVSTAEKLTAGIGFFRAGNHALAVELLTSALPELTDSERVAATNRFIGHAHAAHAASLLTRADTDPTATEAELDRAREAWRKAGNHKDYPAQRFFMAQETARSPELGYAAGWQHLTWHGYTSLDGWSSVVGNYGGAMTGGQGLPGMWQRHPVHLIVWGVLAFLPLCLALFAFLRPKRETVSERPVSEPHVRPVSKPPISKPPMSKPPMSKPPMSKPLPAPKSSASSGGTRAPATKPPQAQQRTPSPPTRPPAATPVTKPPSAKAVSPKPPGGGQMETEASMTPLNNQMLERREARPKAVETEQSLRPAKAPEKKVRNSGEFAALERRTPRPEDDKKR
ncbi:MAG: tetratricopeptide repeat protein [Planctomycetes bacterium]|nr:tetratricopeptide repeat protein [Planctomycetota bacterium]